MVLSIPEGLTASARGYPCHPPAAKRPPASARRLPGAMAVAADTYTQKTDEQKAITEMVRQFADN
jgi:hypothetical protein